MEKIFIAKSIHVTQSNGDGYSRRNLRCKIEFIKGDDVIDDKSTSIFFPLADSTYARRKTAGASINGTFCAHASKVVARLGRTENLARTVNGFSRNNFSRSEWEDTLEKEGKVNTRKMYMANLVVEKLSCLRFQGGDSHESSSQ